MRTLHKSTLALCLSALIGPSGLRSQEDILFWPARIDVPTVNPGPQIMLTGDFDEDGYLDVMVLSEGVDRVALYRGTGQGTFAFMAHYPAGLQQERGFAEDLNRDGHLDVAMVNYLSDDFCVLLGWGDGTFEPTVFYSAGNGPTDMVLEDLNDDDSPDIVVGVYWNRAVTVFLNDGAGAFLAQPTIPMDDGVRKMAGGDLTGDGHPDVALLTYDDDRIEILEGDGTGGLTHFGYVDPGRYISEMITVDVNGDEFLDIVTDDQMVLLGHGDGTFTGVDQPDLQGTGDHILPVDYNGDSYLDLALCTYNRIQFFRGDGTGYFEEDASHFVGSTPSWIGFGDVDEDGIPDLFSVNSAGNAIAILIADGHGSYHTVPAYDLPNNPVGMAADDFIEDGYPDIALGDNSPGISIWQGLGNGEFQFSHEVPTDGRMTYFVTGDLNGDSHADLVASHEYQDNLSIFLGDGGGGFSQQPFDLFLDNPVWLAIGRFDEDEHPDIAVAVSNSKEVSVIFGDGLGQFEMGPSYALNTRPRMIEGGDFDGDGADDLALVRQIGYYDPATVDILRNDGSGSFTQTHAYTVPKTISGVLVGDYDGDAIPDIAVASGTEVNLLYGRGDGSFDSPEAVPVVSAPSRLRSGEFDGDGNTDLVVSFDSNNRNVGILFGLPGGGMVFSGIAYGVEGGSGYLAVGDFDDDGSDDIAVAGPVPVQNDDPLSILMNRRGITGIDPGDRGGPAFPRAFALSQNYPNPFNPSTTIRYGIPDGAGTGIPDVAGTGTPDGAGRGVPATTGVNGSGREISGASAGGSVRVRLDVYDIRGRLVRRLVDRQKEPGRYEVHWDGRDDRGAAVGSGVYLYRFEAGDYVSTRKMVLVR